MATLDSDVKLFIVQALARFSPPSVVVEAVAETFAITIDRRQAWRYGPDNPELAEKWREVFEVTRREFLADVAAIGIAHQVVRLRELDTMFHRALRSGNLVLAAALLEQAAKEEGGAFTNRREIKGTLTLEQALARLDDEDDEREGSEAPRIAALGAH